jgi:hypothetical protein
MTWVLSLGRSSFAIAFGVLIGAAAAILGARSAVHRIVVEDPAPQIVVAAPASPDRIVDVSRSALDQVGPLDGLVGLLALDPTERVARIGGAPASLDALAAGWRAAAPGDYLDIEIASASGAVRRVVVLVHR